MSYRTGSVLRWVLLGVLVIGDASVAGICCLAGPFASPPADACCAAAGVQVATYTPERACDGPETCTDCKWFSNDRTPERRHDGPRSPQPELTLQPHSPATGSPDTSTEWPLLCCSPDLPRRSHGPPVSRGPPLA